MREMRGYKQIWYEREMKEKNNRKKELITTDIPRFCFLHIQYH